MTEEPVPEEPITWFKDVFPDAPDFIVVQTSALRYRAVDHEVVQFECSFTSEDIAGATDVWGDS